MMDGPYIDRRLKRMNVAVVDLATQTVIGIIIEIKIKGFILFF